MVEKRLIDANALSETLAIVAKKMAKSDAQKALMGRVFYILDHRHEEVVRCKDCQHGVFDAGKGVWKCVESAEWDGVTGDWIGPVIYRPRDFYCANGERRWSSEY